MSDDLVPLEGGAPELPAVDAEKLLSGEPLPADASEQARALSEVLAGLTAPGTPRELTGEKGALTAFRAVPGAGGDPGRPFLTARRGVRVAALATVGSLALGGVAAAATTGSLPGPLQRAAHVLGAPAGDDQDDQGDNQDDQGDHHGSPSASPTSSESPEPSSSAKPSTKPSGSANGVGPDATGPAAYGLCHAFANTTTSDSVAFRNLQRAAAAKGLTLKAYCTVIIALGPGNHHEASNGSSAKHVQHGNSGNGHHKHKGTPNPHAGGSSSGSTS